MGICASSPMNPVPILDMEVKKEDPSKPGAGSLPTTPESHVAARRGSGWGAPSLSSSAMEGLKPTKETTVLVTGGSSWVGAYVAKALIEAGYSVRAAVSNKSSARVDYLRDMGCVLVAVPDLLADEGWAEAMAGCAGFAHVNSLAPSPLHTDAAEMIREAVEGTELALRFAAEASTVRRVVVASGLASICGSQREANPEHQWSEADHNDAPSSAYSKSKTAAEATVWELADKYKDKFSVCTVHPAVVLGTLLPAQPVSSTMSVVQGFAKGQVMSMMFGVCDAADVAEAHVLGLERKEAVNQRYLVCSRDQISTLELAQWALTAGASGVDLAKWGANEEVQKMAPKKPATDNRKVEALFGRALIAPETSLERAVQSLTQQGLI
mmetsp:Transcript_20057/g.46495  ORF Transcript_20057/g.46495 Transcript_20057/m.46495 type:complete len:382 (-) Transcript_20057:42-1187(-)